MILALLSEGSLKRLQCLHPGDKTQFPISTWYLQQPTISFILVVDQPPSEGWITFGISCHRAPFLRPRQHPSSLESEWDTLGCGFFFQKFQFSGYPGPKYHIWAYPAQNHWFGHIVAKNDKLVKCRGLVNYGLQFSWQLRKKNLESSHKNVHK